MDNTEKKGFFTKIKEHKFITVLAILLIAVIVFRLVTYFNESMNKEIAEETPVSVKISTAEYGNISVSTPLSGRISPAEEAAVVPMATGTITAVHVKVGDYVEKGTLLFEIDKGTVATSYNKAKAAYDLSKTTYDNMTVLYNEGAVSKTEFDQAQVGFINAQETLKAASEQYSFYNVTAPISGYVTSLSVSAGSMASPSMAASIADTGSLQIDTTVSEYVIGLIAEGDTVDVRVQALGDKTFTGTITALSPAPALGTLTYPITISLDNSSGELMSGMFAEIQIKSDEAAEAVCVDSNAVVVKNGKTVVVTLNSDNIPVFNEVKTGIDNGEKTEILSGLEAGSTIVVSGQDFVKEGVAVRVLE